MKLAWHLSAFISWAYWNMELMAISIAMCSRRGEEQQTLISLTSSSLMLTLHCYIRFHWPNPSSKVKLRRSRKWLQGIEPKCRTFVSMSVCVTTRILHRGSKPPGDIFFCASTFIKQQVCVRKVNDRGTLCHPLSLRGDVWVIAISTFPVELLAQLIGWCLKL